MPIKTLQKRLGEIGRLRMGRQVPTRNGKTRPERLAEWRLTSAQQGLLEYAMDLYGGGPIQPWQGAPTEHVQYELFTESPALKVLIPPGQIISQWMESWSGGGCKRRCDGEREYLGDQACLCQQETARPQDYACKPTTRLNVILRDVPAVGVWRLEIHGYYGAVELAGMAQLLEDAGLSGRVVPAELRIEQRTIKRPGEPPKHFAVPVLSPESAFLELVVAEQRGALEMRAHTFELEAPEDMGYDPDTGEVLAGELVEEPFEGSPTGPAVTTTPAGPVAASRFVPKLTDVQLVRTVRDAKQLVQSSTAAFQALIPRAITDTFDIDPHKFWDDATVHDWKQALEYAVELHDHQQHENQEMSPVAAGPPVATGGSASQTSNSGRAAGRGTRTANPELDQTAAPPEPEGEAGTGGAPNHPENGAP